jgi:hypothetical protein
MIQKNVWKVDLCLSIEHRSLDVWLMYLESNFIQMSRVEGQVADENKQKR